MRISAAVALSALLTALQPLAQAKSEELPPPSPIELHVRGGDRWQSTGTFALNWRNPAMSSPIAAIHYRVLDSAGVEVIKEVRSTWFLEAIDGLQVPHAGDPYTAEVWLENAKHVQGARAAVKLRFDDSRPGFSRAVEGSGWIARTELPYSLHLLHPAGQDPPSGIRGYAVSVDGAPESSPCAATDVCTDAETDLRTGADGDVFKLSDGPEGTSYVHAVAVSGSGMRSSAVGHSTIRVDKTDPVTRLAGAPGGWTSHSVTLVVTATDTGSGMELGDGGDPFTAIQVDGGAPTIASGSTVGAAVIESGIHSVSYYARDAAGNTNDGDRSNGVPNRPPSTAQVRIDRDPPLVAFAPEQDPSDPEAIEARVSDALSGPDPSRGQLAVRPFGSGDRFEALATRAGSGVLRARWDSESYPAGAYEFRATAYDLAGNGATTQRRAGGAGMVLPNPLKSSTTLSAGFGGAVLVWHHCARRGERRHCQLERVAGFDQRPAERAMPFGRGTLFSGQLVTSTQSPLPGRQIKVIERFPAAAGIGERSTEATTDGDGRFTVRLAPGPSREVFATFDGGRTLNRAASQANRLEVLTGVRLRASSAVAKVGGAPVVFRGAVATVDGPIPPSGLLVQLQFRLPGLPWSEFRTVQTDPRGRFRYAYRFTDDDSAGVRFQFRAYVPAAQGDWPYEPGGSRPVAVRGR